ncbi:MAG: glycosyltransferase family 4 protein [Promethearchaeota archaeon]
MDIKKKKPKRKIVYVALDVAPQLFRGSSTHTLEIAKNLGNLGNEVHIICRRLSRLEPKFEISSNLFIHRVYRGIIVPIKPRSDFEEIVEEKVAQQQSVFRSILIKLYMLYLNYLFPLYFAIIIAKIIKRHKIDIILERGSSLGAGAIASIISRRPMVSEIIGTNFKETSLKIAKKIITYSYNILPKKYIDKTERVTAAANIEMFTPEINGMRIRKKYGLENFSVVGYAGCFAEWHGVLDLVKASKKVISKTDQVRFLMIGPNSSVRVLPTVRKMNLDDYFIFTDLVPYNEIPSYLNACDILVAPYNPSTYAETRKFGFFYSPIKLFEYMACGRPLITSSCGNIPSIIKDKATGCLFEPGNINDLATAILFLLENRELSKKMGNSARKEVETKYSWKSVTKKIERILKSAVLN